MYSGILGKDSRKKRLVSICEINGGAQRPATGRSKEDAEARKRINRRQLSTAVSFPCSEMKGACAVIISAIVAVVLVIARNIKTIVIIFQEVFVRQILSREIHITCINSCAHLAHVQNCSPLVS